MKSHFFFPALALAATTMAGPVITWVAPYKVGASKDMLQQDFGGVGMKDGLTYLALQFWITNGPGLKMDGNVGDEFDSHVRWFRDWGRSHGVKVTLCVTDFVGGWNWDEARRSFADNRAAFVASLVAEADRLDLDGVELDLEGLVTPTMDDTKNFVAFCKELGAALHAKGKVLTVASYAAQWNAPNWTWWPTLMKDVDAVTAMGYEEAGKASTTGFNYAQQKAHANPPGKLMIGMPSYHGSWQGNTAQEQLDWVVADGVVGVGIWEATLPDPAWQTAAVWQKLKTIKAQGSAGTAYRIAAPRLMPMTGRFFDLKGAWVPRREAVGTRRLLIRR